MFDENYYDDDDADTKPVFPEDEELQGTADIQGILPTTFALKNSYNCTCWNNRKILMLQNSNKRKG